MKPRIRPRRMKPVSRPRQNKPHHGHGTTKEPALWLGRVDPQNYRHGYGRFRSRDDGTARPPSDQDRLRSGLTEDGHTLMYSLRMYCLQFSGWMKVGFCVMCSTSAAWYLDMRKK
jgi:hypothetical protein